MYFVIAAAHPTEQDAKNVVAKVQSECQVFNERRSQGDGSTIDELKVDKSQFKIGSLGQLMVLNETC